MNSISGFGDRLRAARKKANLTQKELAEKVGAKHNSVSDWENNKNMPDPDTIVLLCDQLGVGASYLLNTEENYEVNTKLNSADILYVSIPSGKKESDDVRRFLHELIDQLDDENLALITDVTLKISKR